MTNRLKSFLFDFFQISSILFILFTGPIISSNRLIIFLQIFAILILVLAAWEMRKTQYFRIPDVGKQHELVKSGIYKYIRNPMYFSELLFTGVLVGNSFSLIRFLVMLIMLVNFIYKINYEEEMLNRYFKEYKEYKKTSWRLAPFVY